MEQFPFKVKPFEHQARFFFTYRDREFFGLHGEQGTGKSKMLIDTAAYLYDLGRINAVVVIAPNGVHRNWILREIPTHMPDHVPVRGATFNGSMTKKQKAAYDFLYQPGNVLRILAVNIESMSRKEGYEAVAKFLRCVEALVIVDESSKIKNPSTERTKNIIKLRKLSKYRRTATGTPIPKSPLDIFGQFMFLDPDVLPTQSFTAFRSRYAVLLDDDSPLMRSIKAKSKTGHVAPIIARDPNGKPMFKNLAELDNILKPHTFRILKSECLDLPPKIYTRRLVGLSAEQAREYVRLVKRLKEEKAMEDVAKPINRLASLSYLQQIIGGWLPGALRPSDDPLLVPPGIPLFNDPANNPRVAAVLDDIEEAPDDEKYIIWARYTYEIKALAQAISAEHGPESVVTYYGEVSRENRDRAIDRFQNEAGCRFFIGNPQAGGTGITLTAASSVIYYSNSFNLEDRLQSEDRCHRIGQSKKVRYVDIEAEDTIDTKIIEALKTKKEISDLVLGDRFQKWLE